MAIEVSRSFNIRGILYENKARIPIEIAISVDIGIPQPAIPSLPG